MENLYQIVYTSIATRKFTEEDLLQLLAHARSKNRQLDVTGMLLYDNYVFLQVLEGEKQVISGLYSTIKQDPRHRMVTIVLEDVLEKRSFADWSMGFSNITQQQLTTIEGVNDFFKRGKCLNDVDVGTAKRLLQSFAASHGMHRM